MATVISQSLAPGQSMFYNDPLAINGTIPEGATGDDVREIANENEFQATIQLRLTAFKGVLTARSVETVAHFQGSGFVYGEDVGDLVFPTAGNINTLIVGTEWGVRVRRPVGVETRESNLTISDLDLDVASLPGLDTDELWSLIFDGDDDFTLNQRVDNEVAGDGRDLNSGNVTGGNDVMRLFETEPQPPLNTTDGSFEYSSTQYFGDFFTVGFSATLQGGNDSISGLAPKDLASGDVERAIGTLTGGNDVMDFSTSTRAVTAFGDAVSNATTATGGNDTITGTDLNDVLVGDVGTVEDGAVLFGGDDSLIGGAGNDQLFGDQRIIDGIGTANGGNDRLFGGLGDDTLRGGGGDDDLEGGAGLDRQFGEGGDDFFLLVDPSELVAGEIYDGGEGTDEFVIFFQGDYDFTSVDLTSVEGVRMGDISGRTTVRLDSSQINSAGFSPDAVFESLVPTGSREFLIVQVTDGSADLSGFSFIGWENFTDVIEVTGSDLNDTIVGTSLTDFLFGRDGDDFLDGRGGNDSMSGGLGDDTYMIDGGDIAFEHTDAGTDLVRSSVSINALNSNIENLELLVGENAAIAGIGNEQNNRISGNEFDNKLGGGAGRDTLKGHVGNDTISGNSGRDKLFGGSGGDTLKGGNGNDKVFGGNGSDKVFGGKGSDLLNGGGGRDVLQGQKGSDVLTGGSGRDAFVFNRGDGHDTITDFAVGIDHIQIGRGASRLRQLDFEQRGDDVLVSFRNVEITVEDMTVSEIADSDNFLFV